MPFNIGITWYNLTITSHVSVALVGLVSYKLFFIATDDYLSVRVFCKLIVKHLVHFILAAKLSHSVLVPVHSCIHALVESTHFLFLPFRRHLTIIGCSVVNVVDL
jgi:Flp pilus assembly protein protease CpaA